MDKKLIKRSEMTPDQLVCHDLLCRAFYGEHHTPRNVYEFGRGIYVSIYEGISTFDFNYLTRIVVLAHDMMVRVEILNSAPRHIGIALHKRSTREGPTYARHPTIEQAVADVRGTPN